MGVGNNSGKFIYANITKGKVAIKKDGVTSLYGFCDGWLKDIQIRDEEYQGKKFKTLGLMLDDGTECYLLKMRLISG